MRTRFLSFAGAAAILLTAVSLRADQPEILSFSPGTGLLWTNPVQGNIAIVERATNLTSGAWAPFFYDWGTNGFLTTAIPQPPSSPSFFRIAVQTNIPDPSLLVDLSFDNAFSNGVVLDISGHGNHGLRYGRPGYPTNWPSFTIGPDGSRAAEFHQYFDGYGRYGKSGDYVGIPFSPQFTNLTEATLCAWVHYYTSYNNDINNDHNSSILDTGKDVPGTFNFGREYSDYTVFSVWVGLAAEVQLLTFPDVSPIGESGGWHYYSVTFSNGFANAYFDGSLCSSSYTSVPALSMAGYYIGIAGWTFNETPQMDLSVDEHPNNAWINGAVDDVRIYNRALDSSEISALYLSFDKLPPTNPVISSVAATSSSQVEIHWTGARDIFGIAGYVLRRNNNIIATVTNTVFFDSGLAPDSTNSYSVQAFDPGGNFSARSPEVAVRTLPPGAGVDLVLDDADGSPWITQIGPWFTFATIPGYYGTGFLSDEKIYQGQSLVFRPPLPESGDYTVYIRYPGRADIAYLFATSVPVDIVHAGLTNTVIVNEQANYGTWSPLGQFSFSAGTNDFIRLRTDGTTGYVVGDAFRFVK